MKMVEEIKNRFFSAFIFLTHNILLEGSVSQNFDLGLSYVFMIQNINNSEKIIFQNFYIT